MQIHVVTEFPCSPLCLFSLYLPLHQSYALLFSLLPFFFATAVYFYLWTPNSPASIMTAGVKATPILLLAAVVLTWNGSQSVLGVVGGLVFSAIGDICLVWPELFIHGKSLVCTQVKQIHCNVDIYMHGQSHQ